METKRRNFMKSSLLVAGASTIPSLVSAQVAGSATLKVAVVGCGGRGTGAAKQALQVPGVKIVALADAFPEKAQKCLKSLTKAPKAQGSSVEVPKEHVFSGLDAYKKAIDLCDVLVTAAPPGYRPFHFAYAVKQGKHVFMEKPVAASAAGIRMVIESAKQARAKNLKVVVGLQRHFDPVYVETRKRILDGEIGDVISMHCYWMSGGVWVRGRKPGATELQYQSDNWYYFYHMSGGGIVEQHIHNIDACLWMSGLKVEKAYGTGGNELHREAKFGNIYDHFAIEYELEKGAMMNSFWRHHKNTQGRVGELIQGAKATASYGRIVDRDGKTLWKYSGKKLNPYQEEHNQLFAHIRENREINMAEDAAMSCMVGILGRMSAHSGRSLPMSRAIKAEDQILPDTADWNAPIGIMPDENGFYADPVPGQYDPFTPPGALKA